MNQIFEEVTAAVREKWERNGSPLGHCAQFAATACEEFRKRGIEAEVCRGGAGFSPSASSNDVLVWCEGFTKDTFSAGQERHLWVRIGKVIYDASAMTFNLLLAKMEEADGIKASGAWVGDFVTCNVSDGKNQFENFKKSRLAPGVFFYKEETRGIDYKSWDQGPVWV